jgi:hypothetical protein
VATKKSVVVLSPTWGGAKDFGVAKIMENIGNFAGF